jgi:hypothetical protein
MGVLFYLSIISIFINLFEISAQNFSINNISCESNDDCFHFNRFCFNNECKCGPNYRWNTTLGKCEYFDCYQDIECQEFDRNRVCVNQSRCECRKGYTEDTDTKICQKSSANFEIKNNCTANSYCRSYGDINQVCVDNLCECLPNYKWNSTQKRCNYFNCFSDIDCEVYDRNRICSNTKCICSPNSVEDSVNKKCVINNSTTTPIPIGKYCSSITDCGRYQFCINNRCECQPNYKYSVYTQECYFQLCYYNSDCDQYDRNSICSRNNLCECRFDYVLDPKTRICNMTVEKYCNNIAGCGINQFCINNLCECQSGYRYNQFDNLCHLKFCKLDSDCDIFDKNSVCSGDLCKCRSGYTLDPNTKICNITVEKSCNSIADCGSNQFCVKNLCECQPNYVFNNFTNSCEFKSCNYDEDCNQFDSNRICNTVDGMCDSCKTYYKIDTNTQFCNTTVGRYCLSNSDCTNYGDNNQVCVDGNCMCKPNYKLDTDLGYCSHHDCIYDSDCQTYDKHRICNFFSCQCDTNYKEDSLTKKCNYYSNSYQLFWLILIPVPIICVIIAIYLVNKRRFSRIQPSNMSINSNSPIIQPNQYLGNSSQHITTNESPPPYSRK